MATAESRMLAGEVSHLLALAAKLSLRPVPRRRADRSDGPLRALFLSAYPPSHRGTLGRLTGWAGILRERGVDVVLRCPCSDEEFAAFGRGDLQADRRYLRAMRRHRERQVTESRNADVVWLQRGLFPFGPFQRPTFERILARYNPRIVFDLFDSLWVQKARAFAAARSRLAAWLNPADHIERIAGLCRAVTVGSPYLADHLRGKGPDLTVLPMVLDPGAYPMKVHGPKKPVVFGWMGNEGNLSRLRTIGPALARAALRIPIRLRVVSSVRFELPGVEVESLTHPYSPASEVSDLMAMDAGLLPLNDDEADRGKAPLKLLQYAAAGLPIVASPVAFDSRHFRNDVALLTAKNEAEWARSLVRVAKFVTLRRRLGREARRVVETHYSFEAHADTFHGLLRRVAGTGREPRDSEVRR